MRITEAHADCVAKSAVPIAMTWEEIREASLNRLEIKNVIESLREDGMKKCSTAYQAVKCELAECNGALLRGNRIVMPVKIRRRALELAHEGHQGLVKMKQRIKTKL